MLHKMNVKQVYVVPDNGVVIVQLYFYVDGLDPAKWRIPSYMTQEV